MHPTLLSDYVHTYGLMLAVGFYAAWWLAARRAKDEGVEPDIVGNLVLISILAGVGGARLLFVVLYHDFSQPFWTVFKVWEGGLVFYGGAVGAAVAALAYLRWRGVPAWRMADIAAPAVAIGQAFGRLGCFLNGCCYGGVCTAGFPAGVRFPAFFGGLGDPVGSPVFMSHLQHGWLSGLPQASLPVHPTQLYASVSLFAITALLVAATPFRRRYGEIFALLCILNGAARFAIELVRRDTEAVALGLNPGQLGAVLVFALGVGLWAWARSRGRRLEPGMALA